MERAATQIFVTFASLVLSTLQVLSAAYRITMPEELQSPSEFRHLNHYKKMVQCTPVMLCQIVITIITFVIMFHVLNEMNQTKGPDLALIIKKSKLFGSKWHLVVCKASLPPLGWTLAYMC